MPDVTVSLPTDVYDLVTAQRIDLSSLVVRVVREELQRSAALDETERYMAELRDEVGEPTLEDDAWAEAIVTGIRDHMAETAR